MYDRVFCKNSERLKPLTIFAKSSTLYVRLGKEFVSVIHINTIFENNLIIFQAKIIWKGNTFPSNVIVKGKVIRAC